MSKTKGEGRAKNEKSQRVLDTQRAEKAKKRREEEKEWAEKSGPVTVKKTKNNPTGEVRQCDRRDIHEPHEYQAEFGAYFDIYCPGNDGTRR